MQRLSLFSLVVAAECFQLPSAPKLQQSLSKLAAPAAALAVTVHSEAAHAKSVLGVNGALDFGPLAGDQPGGEGTGKVRAQTHFAGTAQSCPRTRRSRPRCYSGRPGQACSAGAQCARLDRSKRCEPVLAQTGRATSAPPAPWPGQ